MKKNLFFIILIISIAGCQREKANELGVTHNKSLIIPPTNDLPLPGSNNELNNGKNSNLLVETILNQTEANEVDPTIVDKIDESSGYETNENFIQWLFKGKSKR
tara:strand:+ start:497 stop:808 length:312 start_codon:yes stop_codon:yes gene_type:complete